MPRFWSGLFRAAGLLESLGVYLPAAGLTRLVGLGRALLLIWLLPVEEFGLLSVALLVVNVAQPLCSLGLNEAIARYVPHHEARGSLLPFVRRGGALVLAAGLILTALLAVGGPFVGEALLGSRLVEAAYPTQSSQRLGALVGISAAATLSLIAYWLVGSVLRGLRLFRALSVMELTSSVLFAALAVGAVLGGWRSAEAILGCYLLSVLAPGLVFGLGCLRQLSSWPGQRDDRADGTRRRLLTYGLWLAGATVMWQLLQYWPMWYLNKAGSKELTAVYAGVRVIAQLVMVAAGAMTAVVAAVVTRTWETRGAEAAEGQLRLAIKTIGLGLLSMCGAASLCRTWLIGLFPAEYEAGGAILPVLLGNFMAVGMVGLLVVWFGLIEKTVCTLAVYAAGTLCNVWFGLHFMGAASGAYWGQAGFLTVGVGNLLPAAAWTGMLAAVCAAAVCLCILRVVGRPLDAGTVLISLSALLLGLRWEIMLTGAVLLVLTSWASAIILSRDEKQLIRTHLVGAIRLLRRNRQDRFQTQ
ncbi:MAG TPA: oligosaccharide flippase family protein [Phycisphaerae bacterium]|nr:oligosaccharide flippase family protein [Phycisphaerae bacterium]